ncbi:MAG TPA: RecQ family ATP-dependent DNA helicase [Crocinitomix sp.]|nr:RecQ family ATP-dependent DNA helicase [Crocinitomix sp.]
MNININYKIIILATKKLVKSKEILKHYWGYDNFRDVQEDIIASVLSGKDTLALLPTGGGKSICYQVPGIQMEGICLVVSPLIALIHDQVNNLKKRGIKAIALTSGMTKREIDIALDNAIYGDFKFLYVSPERLKSKIFLERFHKMKINLIAVDEAHCISQWGYDFRPPYLEIAELKKIKPIVPFLALTATATPEVVTDIQEKLKFKASNVFKKSFERENLVYITIQTNNKLHRILEFSKKIKGSGIIYCTTRRMTKNICKHLLENKISADFYHGGLDQDTRKLKQNAWVNNQTKIIVATNAFGMGIDKPDVRFVLHYDIPQSIEAYFQEAGRGGRDLKKSRAIMFYEPEDIKRLINRIELKYPPIDEIKQIYNALGNHFQLAIGSGKYETFTFDIAEFSEKYNSPILTVYNAIHFLELAGLIRYSEDSYESSKFKILVTNYELYQYQVKNDLINKIIKFILRSYMGAFEEHISINEYIIAKKLNIKVKDLVSTFNYLSNNGIIEYFPRVKGGSISYLSERLTQDNFTISKNFYENRKKIAEQQLDDMLKYVDNKECRSQYLLKYFGESNPKPCGKCNVCLHIDDSILEHKNYLKIKKLIKTMFEQTDEISIEAIVVKLNKFEREEILYTLRWMAEHDLIYINNDLKTVRIGIK